MIEWRNRLSAFKQQLSRQGKTLSIALRDPLPLLSRVLLWVAFASLVCPLGIRTNFLPGGFSYDVLIAPSLILLGLLIIHTGILTNAKKFASSAACGIVCLALFSSMIYIPDDPISVSKQAAASVVQPRFLNPVADTSNCETVLYCFDYQEEPDDWVLEGENKNKGKIISAVVQRQAHSLQFFDTNLLSALGIVPPPVARWISAHGHQLQLYNSGDESESSAGVDSYYQSLVRPPCKQKGGLFHAVSRSRFQGFPLRAHSRTGRFAKVFGFGLSTSSDCRMQSKQRHRNLLLKYALATHHTKYWLLNQALLL